MNDEQRSPVSGAPAEDMSGGGLDDAVAALQAQREQMQQSAPESIEDEPVLTAQPEEVPEDDSEDQAEDQLTDDVSESPEGEQPDEDSPTVYEWSDDAVFLVDGEEIPAAELKAGRLREADYTRKTQQVAELRKSAEAQSQTAFAAVQAAQALLRSDLSKFEAIDWSELAGNPTEFQRKQALYQQAQNKVGQFEQQVKAIEQHYLAAQQAEKQAAVERANRELPGLIPGWSDAKYYELIDFGTEAGLPREELLEVTEPAFFKLLDDARAFRGGQKAVTRKLAKPSPTKSVKRSTPASKQTRQMRDLKALEKSVANHRGSDISDDAVALFRAKRKAGQL